MGNFFVAGGAALSSDDDCATTPKWFFKKLEDRFGKFDLDAASSDDNALCLEHYTKDDDALSIPWGASCVLQPSVW